MTSVRFQMCFYAEGDVQQLTSPEKNILTFFFWVGIKSCSGCREGLTYLQSYCKYIRLYILISVKEGRCSLNVDKKNHDQRYFFK